jgi:cytosine/adenosine deaminase-related metal-dependent hydrolase
LSVEAAAPLTVTGASLDGEAVALRCHDGAIVALGPEVAPQQGDETIDAGGAPLVAPLLNAHTHAAMTLFRGYGGDLPLMRWLREKIWPVEAKLEAEDVYWGARLACLEMVRTGTTRFWDMYWHPEETARAILDAGLRATVGAPLFDLDGDAERLRETARESVAKLLGLDETVSPPRSPRTRSTRSARSRCAGRRSWRQNRACRSTSTSPRPPRRSMTASPSTVFVPPPTSTGWACWASARCWRTASGSTARSSS